jgi:hypothetical protein
MRDLVQKLPSGNPQHDHGTSDDTIAAVLATLNEVIKKHPEFSRLDIVQQKTALCCKENSFMCYFNSTSFPRIYFNQSSLTKSSDSSVLLFQPFRSLLEAGGVDRLMTITRQRTRFSSRVVKFAGQVKIVMPIDMLFNRWQILYLFEQHRFSQGHFEMLT